MSNEAATLEGLGTYFGLILDPVFQNPLEDYDVDFFWKL